MVWWAWLIIGIGAGGGAGAGAMLMLHEDDGDDGAAVVMEEMMAPTKALTDLDLIKPICNPDFMAAHGPLLCREMFCRMMQRGIDKASDTACEAIANINNKTAIVSYCHALHPDDRDRERGCVELFDRRI